MRLGAGLLIAGWALGASLGAAVCGTGSQVLTNSSADKVLFLTAASDPSPLAFEALGYNDTAWRGGGFSGRLAGPAFWPALVLAYGQWLQ